MQKKRGQGITKVILLYKLKTKSIKLKADRKNIKTENQMFYKYQFQLMGTTDVKLSNINTLT